MKNTFIVEAVFSLLYAICYRFGFGIFDPYGFWVMIAFPLLPGIVLMLISRELRLMQALKYIGLLSVLLGVVFTGIGQIYLMRAGTPFMSTGSIEILFWMAIFAFGGGLIGIIVKGLLERVQSAKSV